MGLLGFLCFILGVLVTTSSSKCIPETRECSRHWVKLEPHKNLMESENELNSWCRKQMLFYKCLENGLLRNGNLSDLPTNFLISKMFSEDLCTEDSFGRKRYLNNAACINQLNTEYCTLPEYLDIITPDDAIPSRCSLSEKTFSCIAATIVSNCGFDAGRVYRYLLKLISYNTELCDAEGSESLPPCEDPKLTAPKREEELSEIFYGLIHRFGVIPEQVAEQDDPSVFSNKVESPVRELDETLISEAIRGALDNIQEDSFPEEYETVLLADQPEYLHDDIVDIVHDVQSEDQHYKRTPIVTEPFKGLLHYNYSGREYAIYWRQPKDSPIEKMECKQLLPDFLLIVLFRCRIHRRLYDPDCGHSEEKDEPITPELIRDVDPYVPHDSVVEFGPRPHWIEELDQYQMHRAMEDSKFSGSTVESVMEFTLPDACTTNTLIPDSPHNPDFQWWKCPNVFYEGLKEDIASFFLPNITKDEIPLVGAYYSENIAYIYFYETRLHDFENVICERVNDCHPRGRGVFKCTFKPIVMEQCRNCYEDSTSPSPAFGNLSSVNTAESAFEVSSEETNSHVEKSDVSGFDSLPDTLITLLLSRDATPDSDKAGDAEDIMAEDDELVAIDISSDVPEQPQKDSSGLSFVILDQDIELPDGGSDIIPDNLHEVVGLTDVHDSDASYKLPSDNEYKLLRENVLLLQTIKPNEDIHAIYEMEIPENNQYTQDVDKTQ